ncbi:PerC family transcriptional regulator [Escherichia coli]|nr:PerC family transcriptional regulator [Escherichia coli]
MRGSLRAECLRKARRTPVSPVNLTEIKQAVNEQSVCVRRAGLRFHR